MDGFSGIVNNLIKGSEGPNLGQRVASQISSFLNSQNIPSSNFTSSSGNFLNLNLPQLQNFLPEGLRLQLQSNLSGFEAQNARLNIINAEVNNSRLNLSGQLTLTNSRGAQKVVKFDADGFIKLQGGSLQQATNPASQLTGNNSNILNNPLLVSDAISLEQNTTALRNNLTAFITNPKANLTNLLTLNKSFSNIPQSQIANALSSNGANIKLVDYQIPNTSKIEVLNNQEVAGKILLSGKLQKSVNSPELVIKSDFGNFRLLENLNLPNNTRVTFLVDSLAANSLASTAQPQTSQQSLSSFRNLLLSEGSTFNSLFKSLYSGASTSNLFSRLFANPGERFAALKNLWFISASQNGDPSKWLNDEIVNELKPSTGSSMEYKKSLEEVFNFLKTYSSVGEQRAQNPLSSYLLPFFDGNNLFFATLNIDRNFGNNGDALKGQKRFWIEFDQESYGEMKIEGRYVSKAGDMKMLDIYVRSEKLLEAEFQEELSDIYFDLSNSYGFSGNINFDNLKNVDFGSNEHVLGDGLVI